MPSELEGLVPYLLRATQSAAIACSAWVGRGDPKAADQAAVQAMRAALEDLPADATIVIGEGAKDEAPMLHEGERLGTGQGPAVDIAVDPLECTSACANAFGSSIAVLAAAPAGSLWTTPGWYMDKLIVGPDAAGAVDLRHPLEDNLEAVAKAGGKQVSDLLAVVLDKPRHTDLVARLRESGVAVSLIPDGDVFGSLRTVLPAGGADLVVGIGGTPEGVLSACAIRLLGGTMQGRLAPQKPGERERIEAAGQDVDTVLELDDLVGSEDCVFAMTAVTPSPLLHEPRLVDGAVRTASYVVSPLHRGLVIEANHNEPHIPSIPRSPANA